jgi:hypothetical protein
MAKKKTTNEEAQPAPAVDAQTTETTTPDESTATQRRRAKRPMTIPGATLADVFASYLEGMEKDGKSDGTISSYRMELDLAASELGVDTMAADLTPERVLLFFGCDRVTKTRSGRPKSPLSIAKSQGVLRQALQHAERAGLVVKAPLPELAASH